MTKFNELPQEQQNWLENIVRTRRSKYEKICASLKRCGDNGRIRGFNDATGESELVKTLSLVRLGLGSVTMETVNEILEATEKKR